jgi:uncharacterized DUF497 family protein
MESWCSTGTHTICARFGRTGSKLKKWRALANAPIPIYEQDVEGEVRHVYYGETDWGRLLAVVLVERGEKIRVVTAYDLDAGQKKDYFDRRLRGE